MDALLAAPNRALQPTKHNPNGAVHKVDEVALQKMILEWQADQKTELLNRILLYCEPIITGSVFSRSDPIADPDEVLAALRTKIWKKLPIFDAGRGRAFTFCSLVVDQGISEIRVQRNRRKKRYPEADLTGLDCLAYSRWSWISSAEEIEDAQWRIMQVQTICTDEHELKSQRWLVKSFLHSDFDLRRHEAADATVIVCGLHPARARRIHDYTMLEIRRTLLPVKEIPKITPDSLRGTRASALRKYADQLSADDFKKLVYLMHNLAPAIIDSLDHVLNGHPEARPLFDSNYALLAQKS
jgi:hypothetical protein